MQAAALIHLLQLASPSLPIGAYSYSQGLEAAIENGMVNDHGTARRWIVDQLQQVVAVFEAPVLWRLLQAFAARDQQAVSDWTERFVAAGATTGRSRTVELVARTVAAVDAARSAIQPAVPVMNFNETQHYRLMNNPSNPLRVGIGGPVGSGKTALCEMLCKAMRGQYDM